MNEEPYAKLAFNIYIDKNNAREFIRKNRIRLGLVITFIVFVIYALGVMTGLLYGTDYETTRCMNTFIYGLQKLNYYGGNSGASFNWEENISRYAYDDIKKEFFDSLNPENFSRLVTHANTFKNGIMVFDVNITDSFNISKRQVNPSRP